MSDVVTKRMKKAVGDDGSARAGCLHSGPGGKQGAIWDATASIFNPAVACWILNMFAPKQGVCFDPFAGGGTRAIFSAKHGLKYVGIELREAEAVAVRNRCSAAEVGDSVAILVGDNHASGKEKTMSSILRPKTFADFMAYKRDAAQRKVKRQAKARALGFASRTSIRKQLWEVFATRIKIRDKAVNGGKCLVGEACGGLGAIECAYHIVPAQRGDAVRYDEENVVGACNRCNCGEHYHRSKYREVHIRVFGQERIERLEAKARQIVKLTTAHLYAMIRQYRGI